MPVSVQISVDAGEAIAMLQAGASGLQEAISNALERAGEEIRDTAKSLAPVKTGRLRDSITSEPAGLTVTISTNVFYAPFQEFGTRHIRPHPFMRPALAAGISQVQAAIAEAVSQAFGG